MAVVLAKLIGSIAMLGLASGTVLSVEHMDTIEAAHAEQMESIERHLSALSAKHFMGAGNAIAPQLLSSSTSAVIPSHIWALQQGIQHEKNEHKIAQHLAQLAMKMGMIKNTFDENQADGAVQSEVPEAVPEKTSRLRSRLRISKVNKPPAQQESLGVTTDRDVTSSPNDTDTAIDGAEEDSHNKTFTETSSPNDTDTAIDGAEEDSHNKTFTKTTDESFPYYHPKGLPNIVILKSKAVGKGRWECSVGPEAYGTSKWSASGGEMAYPSSATCLWTGAKFA